MATAAARRTRRSRSPAGVLPLGLRVACRRVEGFLAQVLQRRRNHETFKLYRVAQEERPDLVERFEIDDDADARRRRGKARRGAARAAARLPRDRGVPRSWLQLARADRRPPGTGRPLRAILPLSESSANLSQLSSISSPSRSSSARSQARGLGRLARRPHCCGDALEQLVRGDLHVLGRVAVARVAAGLLAARHVERHSSSARRGRRRPRAPSTASRRGLEPLLHPRPRALGLGLVALERVLISGSSVVAIIPSSIRRTFMLHRDTPRRCA